MKALKRIIIVIVSIVILANLAYWGYNQLSNNDRRVIRTLCKTFESGDSLDLLAIQQLLDQEKSKVFIIKFHGTDDSSSPSQKHRMKKVADLDPLRIKEMFFLADGFTRESLRIVVEKGKIQSMICHAKKD